jgi:hypothetical protein
MTTSFRAAYPAFRIDGETPRLEAGKLLTPTEGAPAPAVLICHGSDGVDARGSFHAEALNAAGIATFEIDMWAARGVARGALARPRSPTETLPDAFAALRFLAEQPEVADAGDDPLARRPGRGRAADRGPRGALSGVLGL